MDNVTALLAAQKGSNEGGGGNPHAVLFTAQTLTPAQQAQARTNIGASKAETTIPVSGTTLAITPEANTLYNCGELASLTITDPTAQGAYGIVFTSGATPTVTTIPETIIGLEDFAAEANTLYEINVLDNRAVFKGWPLGVGA